MLAKRRDQWTPADLLGGARLITDPSTNGGTVFPVEAEELAGDIPDAPALAVFVDGTAAFVVGLNPYDAAAPGGILHVAGDGRVPNAWRITKAFLDGLPDVKIQTFTANPGLVRLARRAGLRVLYEQDGYWILGR